MTPDLPAARERIAAAYSPALLADAGKRLAALLAEHLAKAERSAGRVLNWNDPDVNFDAAAGFLNRSNERAATSPNDASARFADIVRTMLDRGHNLHDPRYIGHQVPPSIPVAGLFDAVASVTNQVNAIYEMGPWATAVEEAVIERLGVQLGLPPHSFAGLITHGGSLANTTALLTARNVALGDSWERGTHRDGPPPVLVSHGEAHYCIARSAGILGLGTKNVVKAALDDRRRIDARKLDDTLRDLKSNNVPVVAVVACACATPIGAFDPLHDVADVCAKHAVWLHVDADHGGACGFSETHRHLIAGLERADSFIVDAHKMMFMPALCAFVFYKDRRHRFEAFRQDAPYLFDPSAPGLAEHDTGLRTLECTKRAAAYALWGTWSLFGPTLFGDLVDVTFATARTFHDKLVAAPDFVPLNDPQCNIVVFRHVPAELRDATPARLGQFQLDIRRAIIRSGEFYIVPTAKDGVAALRATVINPLTREEHLDALLEAIRKKGKTVLNP